MTKSCVSIILAAHNADRYLSRSLDALRSSIPENAELLMVDDASTDDTAKLARSRGVTVHTMANNSGPSQARNFGASKATGDYLLFVDADVAIHPGVVSRARDTLDARPDLAAVFGSYDDKPAEGDIVSNYRNLLHHWTHQRGNQEASTFWAGCGAIRKSVFDEVGGFDGRRFPRCVEDIELGYRLREAGRRALLDKGMLCTHLKPWTVASMIRTDIFMRAMPWARLNMERNNWPDDLNIKARQKLSVALAVMVPIALASAAFRPLGGAVAAAGLVSLVVAVNWDFFGFLLRKRGAWFALRCVPLHLLHLLCSGFGYGWVWLAKRMRFEAPDGNSRAAAERINERNR